MSNSPSVTVLLQQSRQGDTDASEQLVSVVYDNLHRLAAQKLGSERSGHTLQATALVHEAWMRLAAADVDWRDRIHFFAVAARTMRRILVDYARSQTRAKRGGGAVQISFDDALAVSPDSFETLLLINETIDKLGSIDTRKRDLVEMVLFGGLTLEEAGEVLQLSPATIHRELKLAKAWLQRELTAASS